MADIQNAEVVAQPAVVGQQVLKYQNGKIYKVVNQNDPTDFYIGSTKGTLRSRWWYHKRDTIANKSPQKLYVRMRELGIDSFHIVLVEDYPCDSAAHLLRREDYWIQQLNPPLNHNRAFLDEEAKLKYRKQRYEENKPRLKEQGDRYREEHKEEIKEKRKQYYLENPEIRVAQSKAYYTKNKDMLNEKSREYHRSHKEETSAKNKEWRLANKEEIARKNKEYRLNNAAKVLAHKTERIRCELCDVSFRRDCKAQHERSQKHKDNMPAPIVPADQA